MTARQLFFVITSLAAITLQAQSPADSLRVSRITDDSTRIMETIKLGVDLIYGGKPYARAVTYLQRAETEAKQNGSLWLQAQVTRRRGDLELAAEHRSEALRYFQQAEQLFTKLADSKPAHPKARYYLLFAKLRIGQVHLDNNSFVEAEREHRAALQYARQQRLTQPDDQKLVASVYNGLSILEGKRRNQPKSLAYIDTAALQSRVAGDTASYYTYLLNAAITRKNLKQYAAAVRNYAACEAYFASQRDSFALTMVYANVPRALLGLNRYDEAIDYAQKALAMSGKTAYRLTIHSDVNEALSHLYEAKGDLRRSLDAFRLAKAQQDTLFTQDKERQMQELTAKYETEKKEAQIQELNAKSRQRMGQMAGLGTGAVLLASLLGWSLYQSKRLRQGSRRIGRQAVQLQLLLKELHHRAKNNLAIVSGLLELQANRTNDGFIKQAFREGQQRIDAMSLIHQRLYQTDAITTVDLRDYVSNLVRSLMHTYGYTPDTLDLNLSLEADAVEADTAIPLGLIINELLTNVFKYAYREVARPRLSIVLAMQEENLLLEIADNGPGIDMAAWNRPTGSFGKQLIHSLSDQLNADLLIDNKQGTCVRLSVPVEAGQLVGA